MEDLMTFLKRIRQRVTEDPSIFAYLKISDYESFQKNKFNKKVVKDYMKFTSEKFAVLYTLDCLISVERVIRDIKTSPFAISNQYHLNKALEILIQERKRLFGLLAIEIGYLNKAWGEEIREKATHLDEEKYDKAASLEKANKIKESIASDVDYKYGKMEEIDRIIEDIDEVLKGSCLIRDEVEEEAKVFRSAYTKEFLEAAKEVKEKLKAAELKSYEYEHLENIANFYALESFDFERLRRSTKDAPLNERMTYGQLRESFKVIRRACKHLRKYRSQVLREANKDKSLDVTRKFVSVAPTVAHDLKITKDYAINDPNRNLWKYWELSERRRHKIDTTLPENFKHTRDRITEIKKLNRGKQLKR